MDERTPATDPFHTTRPLKIEMVLAQLYVGGMEVMVSQLMERLRGRGHDVGVTCILDEGPLFDQLKAAGFRTKLIPTDGWHNLVSPRNLIRWLKSEAPDVVHIHSGAWIKAAIASHRADIPRVIFTHHGLDAAESIVLRMFNWYAARYTHRIVAVSDDLRRTMHAKGWVGRRQIDVLPNGVPTDVFTPETPATNLRRRFGIPENGLIIGNVARMFPVKNHIGLVEAFAQLRRQRDDVYLVLVGDGPLRANIEQAIAQHDLDACVFLTGEIDDLAGVYRSFDVFALTSLNEGTSISILEAMACGTGVVVTAVGGNPALLGEGRFGTLVPSGNTRLFADSLSRILDDAESRTTMATVAREHVTRCYSGDAMCDAYEALYYDRAQRRPGHATSQRSTKECVG